MEPELEERRPVITVGFDLLTAAALVVLAAFIAATSRFISVDSALGTIGLATITVAASRDIGMPTRAAAVICGLGALAYGGWLDLEGWRFMARGGSFGGSP